MYKLFGRLWRDQRGTTPLEFSLLAMIFTLVLVVGLAGRGDSLAAVFTDITAITETARQDAGYAGSSCSGGMEVGDLRKSGDNGRS